MRVVWFIVTALILSSCSGSPEKSGGPVDPSRELGENEEVPLSKRVYYFQHKVIPEWVFHSEGDFYFDIYNGHVKRLLSAASEVVSQEFADAIQVNPIVDRNAVSISFSDPKQPPNCYFSLIQKHGSGYLYYTYEKTMQFDDEEFVGVVGGWDAEGNHSNYGPRSYTTEKAFIDDVLGPDNGNENESRNKLSK